MMKPATAAELRWEAYRYALANDLLNDLRIAYNRRQITAEEYKRIRIQALSGDKTGAVKVLAILRDSKHMEV